MLTVVLLLLHVPWQVDCFAINKEICYAEGREALLQLVEEKGRDFNAINVATCLNRSVAQQPVFQSRHYTGTVPMGQHVRATILLLVWEGSRGCPSGSTGP
jgi:hypothetical protein